MQDGRPGSLIFREVEWVPPGGAEPQVGDVRVEDGVIVALGAVDAGFGASRTECVDGRGLTLLPGVIDPQVHFREPGLTHKEDLATGSESAAAGGVTAFLEMPNTSPPTTDAAALRAKHAAAQGRCRAHWGFFFGATPSNAGAVERPDIAPLACGLKIFMGSSTGTLLVDQQDALEGHFAATRTVPIAVHAEDEARLKALKAATAPGTARVQDHPRLRDETAAVMATERAIELARRHGRRLHILHLSTAEEVEVLRRVRAEGAPPGLITAETLPQYLYLDTRDYDRLGTRAQMNPPVRDARHGAALWRGLLDGTLDCLATDHAPHTLEEKARPYGEAPSGMPGVETLLPLMLHAVSLGRCTLPQIVAWLCEGPARCYGLAGKGRLAVGFDGDVVLVDRRARRTLSDSQMHTRCAWTPYAGWTLAGTVQMTVLRGTPVFRDGRFAPGVFGQPLTFARVT